MQKIVQTMRAKLDLPSSFTLDACRHGGMTELEEAELTDGQGRALSAHKSQQAYEGYAKRTMERVCFGAGPDDDRQGGPNLKSAKSMAWRDPSDADGGHFSRLRFKNYDELNAWLTDKCIAYAKAHRHPELTEQTIWEVFEAERGKLVPYAGRFDGFHANRVRELPFKSEECAMSKPLNRCTQCGGKFGLVSHSHSAGASVARPAKGSSWQEGHEKGRT